jgi:hypothetical protein
LSVSGERTWLFTFGEMLSLKVIYYLEFHRRIGGEEWKNRFLTVVEGEVGKFCMLVKYVAQAMRDKML